MKNYSKKLLIVVFGFILLTTLILLLKFFGNYIDKIEILSPVTVKAEGVTQTEACQIEMYGITPFNKEIKFKHLFEPSEWYFKYSGSIKNLNLIGPEEIVKKIDRITVISFDGTYVLEGPFLSDTQYIDLTRYIYSEIPFKKIFYSILKWEVTKNILLLFILFVLLIVVNYYKTYFERFNLRIERIFHSSRIVLLFCVGLLFCLIIPFSFIADYEDTVKIQSDYFGYKYRAVNIAYKKDLSEKSFFDKYKLDENNIHKETGYEFYLHGGKSNDIPYPPAYPIFLAGIYKLFGVSPAIARYAQLMLLIIMAAFLPFLGFLYWKGKGVLLGMITGLIFIFTQYEIAGEIMTESLQIFTNAAVLFGMVYFERTNNKLSAVILGILLAIALLVKGIIIFVPLIYFIWLIAFNNKRPYKNLGVLILVFFLSLLPWIIYSNIRAGFISKQKFSKEEYDKIFSDLKENLFDNSEIFTYALFFEKLEELKNKNFFISQSDIDFYKSTIIDNSTLSEQEKNDSIAVIVKLAEVKFNSLKNNRTIGINVYDNYHLVINADKFVFLSNNPKRSLLESNNLKSLDGHWHQDDLIEFTYDEYQNLPSLIRIMFFYYRNPGYLAIIMPNKLFVGYQDYPFFALLMVLIIIDFLLLNTEKLKRILLFRHIKAVIFIATLIASLLLLGNKYLFVACFVIALLTIILAVIKNHTLCLFSIPVGFLIFIANSLLITLIFSGSKRFNSIVSFIIILCALVYFFELTNSFTTGIEKMPKQQIFPKIDHEDIKRRK